MEEQNMPIIVKKRQSNIELLRIIAMLLIVASHFSVHGGFEFLSTEITINRLWIEFLQMGGKIGVNIFVFISGFFLIEVESSKINKILKIWLQVLTYSVLIFAIFIVTGLEPFGFKEYIKHIFPITYSHWWFASTFLVMYLLFPYLNKLLKSLNKKEYQKLIALTTICWSIIPTFFDMPFQSNDLIWFMYLYAVAGYIRIYIDDIKISSKKSIMIAIIIIILTFLFEVWLDFISVRFTSVLKYTTYLYGLQKIPMLLIALFIFLSFLKFKLQYNKVINIIAAATFGVYLIHDDYYVRNILWKSIFKNATFSKSAFLIPYSIFAIVVVFLSCALIELFRIHFIEKNYIKYIDNISKYIKKSINDFFIHKL